LGLTGFFGDNWQKKGGQKNGGVDFLERGWGMDGRREKGRGLIFGDFLTLGGGGGRVGDETGFVAFDGGV
jgi:hypothetical protein